MLNDRSESRTNEAIERAATIRDFLCPDAHPTQGISAKTLGKALKKHVGEPVKRGNQTFVLKEFKNANAGGKGAKSYYVHAA